MSFVAAIYLIALALTLVLVSLVVWTAVRSCIRFRGKMLVTCSEMGDRAAVQVDAPQPTLLPGAQKT